MGFNVFISHSMHPEDADALYSIANMLRQHGISSYVAEWDPKYGKQLSAKVKQAINEADVTLVILTDWSSRSAYVNQEIGYAEDRTRIIPLVEKGVEIKGFLVGKEYAEFDRNDSKKSMKNVIRFLRDLKLKKENAEILGWVVIGGLGLLGLASLAVAAFGPKSPKTPL